MTPTKPRKTYPQHCKRCNYSWDSIKPHPKACPSCKHYNWDADLPSQTKAARRSPSPEDVQANEL